MKWNNKKGEEKVKKRKREKGRGKERKRREKEIERTKRSYNEGKRVRGLENHADVETRPSIDCPTLVSTFPSLLPSAFEPPRADGSAPLSM